MPKLRVNGCTGMCSQAIQGRKPCMAVFTKQQEMREVPQGPRTHEVKQSPVSHGGGDCEVWLVDVHRRNRFAFRHAADGFRHHLGHAELANLAAALGFLAELDGVGDHHLVEL